jgi:hypothetical protein
MIYISYENMQKLEYLETILNGMSVEELKELSEKKKLLIN